MDLTEILKNAIVSKRKPTKKNDKNQKAFDHMCFLYHRGIRLIVGHQKSTDEYVLHIEMEKKSENKEGKKHGKYLRREFSYEKFQQTLLLPEDAEAEKIEAKVEHGVLNVHIPKKEKAQQPDTVKQIAVQ